MDNPQLLDMVLTVVLEFPAIGGLAYAVYKLGQAHDRTLSVLETLHGDVLDHTLPVDTDA